MAYKIFFGSHVASIVGGCLPIEIFLKFDGCGIYDIILSSFLFGFLCLFLPISFVFFSPLAKMYLKAFQYSSSPGYTTVTAPPGWLSGERVGFISWWLGVGSPVEVTSLSGVFLPLTSAEACKKSSRWLWKEKLC